MVQMAPAESPAIVVVQTENLSKSYGKLQALDRVSLRVSAACTGLLGPNGAGKSTLIKLLLGLLAPDGGMATVAGCDVLTQPMRLRALVGYMPEHDCLPTDWLAQDFVRYMAELHGLPLRVAIQRASDTLYHVGLGEERYRAIGGFSTGMKQRVKLAQALVHDPKVMLLDEPTNGLDPAGRDEMIALIGRIAHEMGIHVILSSHLLTDVERVADSVIMLNQGKVVAEGSLASLTTTIGTVSVRTRGAGSSLAQWLQERGYAVNLAHNGYEFEVGYRGDEVYDAIRDAAVATQTPIMYLKRRSLTLEDIYLAGESGVAVSAPPATQQKDGVAR
jgi:ABC-2 type transport system ATP-binding protein